MSENFEQDLQTGIRAARQGKNEAAQRYLRSALEADLESEKAWLWLARVVEDPGQRADALQKALDLNPDNQWAAQQLQAVQQAGRKPESASQEEQAQKPGLDQDQPELSLETLECPNCGASLSLSSTDAKTVTCHSCGSVLDLTGKGLSITSETDKDIQPAVPLEPGMTGEIRGQTFQIIGWIKYRGYDTEEVWYWDEWLLAGGDGGFLWLSYDDEAGFVVQEKAPPPHDFDPRSGMMFTVDDQKVLITERDEAEIVALAGELTWRAKVGDEINYADAFRGEDRYSFEYSSEEIEFYKGSTIDAIDMYRAFGLQDMVAREEKRARTRSLLGTVAALFFVFACIGLTAAVGTMLSGFRLADSGDPLIINQSRQARLGPFEVTQENRPHEVVLRTYEKYLPLDSWAVVDVSLQDAQGETYYLFSEEFWHEDGRDDDGYWEESDIKGSFHFKPDTEGEYSLLLSLNSASSNVQDLAVDTTVRDSVLLTWPFVVFAVLAGGVGLFVLIIRPD